MVDAATFIDPVVPVESERAAGAFVKKGMRSLLLWYVGWVTHQMSQSAAAVSRALHIVDDRLQELERQVEVQRVPAAGVVEFPALEGPDAWWVEPAVAALATVPGRVLHAACGDGWLVRRIVAAGGDAYGVDPRPQLVDVAELGVLDLRAEPVAEHLRAVAAAGLGGVVLSGTVEGMAGGERAQLLGAIGTPAGPGRDARHSFGDPSGLGRAPTRHPRPTSRRDGRLRPEAWCRLLEQGGYEAVAALQGPGGSDFLVTAVRADLATPDAPAQAVSAAAGGRWRSTSSSPPSTRTTRRGPTPSSCATRCGPPGGGRRSSPRRSTTTWPPWPTSTGCTPSTRPRATSPSTSSRRPRPWPATWPSTGCR